MPATKKALPEAPGAIDVSAVEQFIGYRARRASLAIIETFVHRMKVFGLQPVTFTLLTLIKSNPGILSSQLCALLRIRSSNLVGLVKQLLDKGLIERVPHPQDGRALGLHLTSAGARLMKRAQPVALAAGMEATQGLTDAERDTLAALLAKVYQQD